MADINKHFSSIAPKYRDLRMTDPGPIRLICPQFDPLPQVYAADVGCGTGRYSLKLHEYMGSRLHLYCIDANRQMLRQLRLNFRHRSIENFEPIHCHGRCLPLKDLSLDFIATFNAVHHFTLTDFLREAQRTLKEEGRLYIYTRTREQNRKNIWGRFFPHFHEKETRLYEIDELCSLVYESRCMQLERVECFKYARLDSLSNLVRKANNHHYSTFCLYSEEEFNRALREFERRLSIEFDHPGRIHWHDENVLYVLKKPLAVPRSRRTFRSDVSIS